MYSKYCTWHCSGLPSAKSKVCFSQPRKRDMKCIYFESTYVISTNICWCPQASFFETCSVAQLSPTFYNPMDSSVPGFPVFHHLLEPSQTHVYWVSDAIQPSHPLSPLSPPALNLSQSQGLLFQWVGSSHQVAKVLELQLQHLSFQWIFKVDLL